MKLDQKIMKNLSGTVFNSIAQIWFFVAKRWILKKGRECVMLLIIYLLKKGLENKLATQRHALFPFKGLFVILRLQSKQDWELLLSTLYCDKTCP